MHNTETPNPIVRRYFGQTLSAFPGWEVAEYADGTFVAANAKIVTDDTLNLDADGEYYDNRAYVNPNL